MQRFSLFTCAVAAMFLAGSCQQEHNPVTNGESSVTFSVSTDELATKAIADGKNVNVLHWEIYGTDVATAQEPLGEGDEQLSGEKTFTVELKLLADQEYNIVFWAEVDGAGHYETSDLRNVKIVTYSDESANDESRAAFFAVHNFSTENGVSINENVLLKRPFAQINLGTTTYETSFNLSEPLKVETTEMTVTKIANVFNTLDGVGVCENFDGVVTFQAASTPNGIADASQKILEVNDETYYWLGMNYLIVNGETDNVTVDVALNTNLGTVNHHVENVPVRENYRTNLLGNLLTTGATFNVVVDERFQGTEVLELYKLEVATVDAMNAALNDPQVNVIEILQDMDNSGDNYELLNREVIINGNDNDLKNTGSDSGYGMRISNNSTVEINDVSIEGGGFNVTYGSSLVINDCDLTIESAQTGQRYCIYAADTQSKPNNKVYINGGNFAFEPYKKRAYVYAQYYTVYITGGTFGPACSHSTDKIKGFVEGPEGEVIVSGGTFGFDPTEWLAPGYQAVKSGDVWVVSLL